MGKHLVSWRFYRLFHEATPDTVYIGITSKPLVKRLRGHLASPLRSLGDWLKRLQAAGQQPHICLFGCLDEAERYEAEQQEYLLLLSEQQAGKQVLNVCHLPRDGIREDMRLQAREVPALNLSETCQAGSTLCCLPGKRQGK